MNQLVKVIIAIIIFMLFIIGLIYGSYRYGKNQATKEIEYRNEIKFDTIFRDTAIYKTVEKPYILKIYKDTGNYFKEKYAKLKDSLKLIPTSDSLPYLCYESVVNDSNITIKHNYVSTGFVISDTTTYQMKPKPIIASFVVMSDKWLFWHYKYVIIEKKRFKCLE